MASISTTWFYRDLGFSDTGKHQPGYRVLQRQSTCAFPVRTTNKSIALNSSPRSHCVRCKKEEDNEDDGYKKNSEGHEYVSVERPPYHSYMDSTSGRLQPASGARASIPGEDYWPEGTSSRVRAARAPEPAGDSTSSPSFGQNPGSRRKKNRKSSEISVVNVESEENGIVESDDVLDSDDGENVPEDSNVSLNDFVVYKAESEEKEEESGFELNKKLGKPHPFIDPRKKKIIKPTLTSDELWWNWRKPEKEQWSRWQRRRPDVETVFLKAMAETGQVEIYGKEPTLTETSLYRARRHLFKEERLQAEKERLEKDGPIAYYSEWVKAWKRDTSREAIQKHYEETGEDENLQLIEMFSHQTDREYRIMMGTDVRVKRDPLAMRMKEEQIKQIWGGDPVYPTVNYIQDPDEIIDYRGPDFHEPTPNMLSFLKEHGKVISREEHEMLLAKDKPEQLEVADVDDAMAKAVDIGEHDDDEEESESDEQEEEEDDDKITRNWSVLKSTPELRKSKPKPKKEGNMSLEEAVDDSENLTDFLMDFEEEE